MTRLSLGHQMQQSLGQHMLLMPRMLQSVEVLQLPSAELEGWLRKAAEGNEALVVDAPPVSQGELAPIGRRGTREDSERHDEMLRNQPAPDRGPAARLEEQLALMEIEPALVPWVRFLIGCIDPSGYLSTDDETLLALGRDQGLEGDPGTLVRAIATLQLFEPRGIGARNAIEALLLQLDLDDPDAPLLRRLLEEFLEEVATNKLPSVARAMGLGMPELRALLDHLRELDPRPGASLNHSGAPLLRPDVVVERVHDLDPEVPLSVSDDRRRDGDLTLREGFEVRVDAAGIPAVRIDEHVSELARDRGQTTDVRRYLRGKLDRARWIVDAVKQRHETLARIAAAVFEHQREFLFEGPGHLAPLRMNRLAEELGIHVSTVSRAVANKYAQTPWGILPLRYFFQARAPGSSGRPGDSGAARDDVRDAVRAVIEAEDAARPLSDDEVTQALAERGHKIARRTVTKYRKELGIASSYRRRRYA